MKYILLIFLTFYSQLGFSYGNMKTKAEVTIETLQYMKVAYFAGCMAGHDKYKKIQDNEIKQAINECDMMSEEFIDAVIKEMKNE